MKPTGAKCLVVVALSTALIILNCSAFAQAPSPQKGASGDGVATEAGRLTTPKGSEINRRDTGAARRNAAAPSAAATIGILPADILNYRVEAEDVETRYSPRTMPSTTVSKDAGNREETAKLAKQLRNPVSALARIYFESNLDFGLSADREGYRYTMNLEPVIPFALNNDWNLISRTRLPIIQQDGVVASSMQTGLGDILQSFYLSPSRTEPLFWGVGTALLIPTATDTRLGAGKLGLGPALVVGKHQGGWTYGASARQIWSVAGHSDRPDVRYTLVQPFVAYTTNSAWSFSLDTESSYDWVGKRWSAPIHVEVSKVVRFAGHPVSVGGALACWAATTPGGPQACGVRFAIAPLFPAR